MKITKIYCFVFGFLSFVLQSKGSVLSENEIIKLRYSELVITNSIEYSKAEASHYMSIYSQNLAYMKAFTEVTNMVGRIDLIYETIKEEYSIKPWRISLAKIISEIDFPIKEAVAYISPTLSSCVEIFRDSRPKFKLRYNIVNVGYYLYLTTFKNQIPLEFGNLENVYTEKENNTFWDGVIHSFTYTNYPISRPELKHRDLAECAKYDALQEALINNFKASRTKEEYLDTIKAMGELRSDMALPVLEENLTICPQGTNSFLFPVADAIIKIRPMTGYCLKRLEETKPLSVEESICFT